MSFITPEYVVFFCLVIPIFFLLPQRRRWIWLLISSYFFYAYGVPQHLLLIIFSTGVDYLAGLMIHRHENERWRRVWLSASIIVNLGVLFFFKYFNFFSASGAAVFGYTPILHDYVLPVGISFYTFQSMSYTIDIYRRKLVPEANLGIMATFVAFFPQLVAGPIERATNLLPQFRQEKHFDADRTVAGFQLILWGFFKKVVIADRLAIYVNAVYNDLHRYSSLSAPQRHAFGMLHDIEPHSGLVLLIATVFFAFQIYCDFSGYSDIAIGTAKVMGFDIMENFRQPYFSQSVREFWGRWHISLSTWFRDYLYIPLGGNRVSLGRNLFNLFLVFLVSGLWHGAGWTFVMWGALHGIAVAGLAASRHYRIDFVKGTGALMVVLRVLLTFAFVCFAWVFFRANSWLDAQYVLAHWGIGGDIQTIVAPFKAALLAPQIEFYLSLGLIAFLLCFDWIEAHVPLPRLFARMPLVLRWGVYYAWIAAVMFTGLYGSGASSFIYFQF